MWSFNLKSDISTIVIVSLQILVNIFVDIIIEHKFGPAIYRHMRFRTLLKQHNKDDVDESIKLKSLVSMQSIVVGCNGSTKDAEILLKFKTITSDD